MKNSKEELIEKKVKLIEKRTGDRVIIEENNNISVGACLDLGNWYDRTRLPKILHKTSIDKIHIFHELLHLEKFFIERYSLIACNNRSLHPVTNVFKNIPEDYVVHKIIKYGYSLNPIDERWFRNRDNLRVSDEEIAANLVNFYTFCEFCPEYKERLSSFRQNCRQHKPRAFSMAERTIEALENMDYGKRDSYNQYAEEIVKIFALQHYNRREIYLSYLSKEGNIWDWNP